MKKQILFLSISLYSIFILAQESYYDDVNLNLTGISLKEALATKIITTHTNNLSYTPGIWNAVMVTDMNPIDNSEVLLIYGFENGSDSNSTNDRERNINDNCTSNSCVGLWNREHVYPTSLATPDLDQDGTNGPPYADAHNLRPCDSQRNSSRGNKKFIAGSGNSGPTGTGWYPGDEWKGDVARIIMYMYLRYDERTLPSNVGFGSNSDTPDDMIDLFLQWNADDPVSTIEKQRNPYHENTSNSDAQGNRNPFIDNPRLATRIWGGPEAEDIWGIYSNTDTEAPSVPSGLTVTNTTTYSIDLSWSASTDNIGVSSYDVYVDGNLEASTSNINYTITGLSSNITYDLTVSARDIADNVSPQSAPLTVVTQEDTEAPSVPMNIVISDETDVSFKITWDPSTDNTEVIHYNIYIDNIFHDMINISSYTIYELTASTTYSVTLEAVDGLNNTSAQSAPVNATTTDGNSNTTMELLISEYVEGSSNNKAIEIANLITSPVELDGYNLRRDSNGGGEWSERFDLTGTINVGDVIVIINANANSQILLDQADIVVVNNQSTNYGEPLNFNGNDPIGLFKDDVLIDIVGEFGGGSSNFAKDKTLRRKSTVVEPNINFDLNNEWEIFPMDTFDDIGGTHLTLSIEENQWKQLSVYPNPTSDGFLNIKFSQDVKVEVFSIFGKKLIHTNINQSDSILDISTLSKGVYVIKVSHKGLSISTKIIKI
ncbi:endonuclease [Flavobacteriaceae bacterium]|jgi:endonuclease I/chitodextrinase|nr:endonuclease [Flavobacteriaceae bacterium]MDC3318678.1 endonuclease [Flavobacteriaceae bacterium]